MKFLSTSRSLLVAALLFVAPAIVFADGHGEHAKKRPNIVFVLTDDHRRDLMGCYGNDFIETPHLDQLAAEGVLFENASVTSAICTPSRASYFLGQYERRHGVNFNSGTAMSLRAWADSFPVRVREAGYFTGYVGKNHVPLGSRAYLTGVMEQTFDYWYAGHGHIGFYPKKVHDIFHAAKNDTQIELLAEGMQAFVDKDANFLEGAKAFVDSRPDNQPFMLTVAFNLPHGAGTSSMKFLPEDDALYRTAYRDRIEEMPIPQTYLAKDDIKTPKIPADVSYVEFRQDIYDYVDNLPDFRERVVRQYQTVTGIDRFVGRLRQLLDEAGVADNTVILFASDHGLMHGEHGLGGKALNYEPCLQIPMIAYDPRLPADRRGARTPAIVQSIDIAPTILDLAGAEVPKTVQGQSLAGIVSGKADSIRDYAFAENLWSTIFGNPRCESVKNQRWKYIRYFKNDRKLYENFDIKTVYYPNRVNYESYHRSLTSSFTGEQPDYEELFDLEADPLEQVNLAGRAEHADLLADLRKRCIAMAREAKGDPAAPPATVRLPYGKPIK